MLPRSGFKTGGGGGAGGSSGDVTAASNLPDNEIIRGDGGVKGVQGSGITISDGASGSLAGTNSGDVTLAGTPDYITISGQVITRAKLDPVDDLNTFASSVLAGLVTDETGSGALVFGTSPVFTTDITVPNVGLHLLDTDASHDLIVKPGSNLTADRTLTVTTGDADRTLTINGDATISGTNTGDGIGGSTGSVDERLIRSDGTGGSTVQAGSALNLNDSGQLYGNSSSQGLVSVSSSGIEVANAEGIGGNPVRVGSAYSQAGIYRNGTLTIRSDSSEVAIRSIGSSTITIGGDNSSSTSGDKTWCPGGLKAILLVEANTAGSGAPNVLAATESGTVLTNEGISGGANYQSLPAASSGLVYEGVVQDVDGQRWTAQAGDTIRLGGSVSATGGYIESTTIGDYVRLVAINATEWIGCPYQGTWTVV